MTHNTNAPTYNNNISADKPSAVEQIKDKASAVLGKLTGKHYTDGTHDHDHLHDNKDHPLHDDNAVHTTGTHTAGTHTGPVGTQTDPVGTQTGPVGTQTDPVGTQTGPVGTQTGPVGTQTGAAYTGAVPGAVPTATHSTGAGITSGGNNAPPAAAYGTHDIHDTH
ncbi:hypothetical protein BGX30_014290, partial [Mortierella sp. GBA39]